MTRRILLPLCILAACGGRASSADTDSDLTSVDTPSIDTPSIDTPSIDTPSIDTPNIDTPSPDESAAPQTLELRRFDESIQVGMAPLGCEYSERIKVSFRVRQLISATCESGPEGVAQARQTKKLLDIDLERVQKTYSKLQVASGRQCESAAGRMSLTVVSWDDSEDLRLLDVEHSGCPLTGVDGEAFVEGLEDLYRVLAGL